MPPSPLKPFHPAVHSGNVPDQRIEPRVQTRIQGTYATVQGAQAPIQAYNPAVQSAYMPGQRIDGPANRCRPTP